MGGLIEHLSCGIKHSPVALQDAISVSIARNFEESDAFDHGHEQINGRSSIDSTATSSNDASQNQLEGLFKGGTYR